MNLHLTLFNDLTSLCENLTPEQYKYPCVQLNAVSIGEHLRHSIEFYVCLKKGTSVALVNYDNRLRDEKLQTDPEYAMLVMKDLAAFFKTVDQNHSLDLQTHESELEKVPTSLARELLYCLDHAIHHQALIKIGLAEMQLDHLVNQKFGVAYSTLRFREKH